MKYPESYENLNYRHRCFVDCYMNENLKNPVMHKNTYCDELASYIFAYQKEKELLECVEIKLYSTDGFGNVKCVKTYDDGCRVEIVVKNAAKFMSLTKCARKVHGECCKALNDIRTMMYSGEDKSKELELKDAIYNSSLHASDFKDRNDNRKMMMKIFGLDQVKIDNSIDIYEASGKNILARVKSEIDSDNGDSPVIPIDISEVEEEDK